jgi:hypothetical protein
MPFRTSASVGLTFLLGAEAALGAPSLLPLRRVRLYETGVGYFERTGVVRGDTATLPVPASHLDDALKTLVVFSGDGPSRVGGVEFGSSVSRGMARALAGLGAEGEALGLERLLVGLKGANVELRAGGETQSGRVVEVLGADRSDLVECVGRKDATAPCTPEPQATLVLMTKAGELRRFRLRDVTSVRPTDPGMVARLGAAVDALSDGSARLLKDVRVMAKSGGSVSLGYVSETPVWRASYRLVLPDGPDATAALQGWALVHNDTDEAWKRVQVELVNGSPDSFLFPLAAPRYARRELVTPENPLSTVPQLVGTTPDAMWDPDSGEVFGAGGLGLSGIGEGGGGRGEGIGLGSVGTLGQGASTPKDAVSSLLSVGNLAGVSEARGTEAGALFRYSLGDPLDLRAHGSALVPFLGQAVVARRIALFAGAGRTVRSAVFLVHRGAQTLPPGTVAVFSDGGFAGESALPRLEPKQSTAVEFGTDLDVELVETQARSDDEAQRLTFADERLTEHFVRRHVVTHRIENRSGSGRDVFLRLGYVNNASVAGADELAYDSEHGRPFAVFRLGARASAERTLKVDEGLRRSHGLGALGAAFLGRLGAQRSLPEAQRKTLLAASAHLARAEADARTLVARKSAVRLKEATVVRFREHARAVGNADGSEAIVERLLAAETDAEAARGAVRVLEANIAVERKRGLDALRALGG